MLDARTYPDPRVIKFSEQVVPVKVNSDRDERTPQRYGVVGQPTILFLTPKGKIIGQFVGFYPPEQFIAQAKKILKSGKAK